MPHGLRGGPGRVTVGRRREGGDPGSRGSAHGRLLRALVVLSFVLMGTDPVRGQQVEVTPYLGHRFGGSLRTEEGRLRLAASPVYGAGLDIRSEDGTFVEVMYSQQSTELQLRRSGVGSEEPLFGLMVRTVQAGAVFRGAPFWATPHWVLTIGVANLDPASAGRRQEWAWTGSVGAGLTVPSGRPLSVRLEGRVSITSLHGPDMLFCRSGTGCVVSLSGPLLWQGQVSAGVAFVL